MRRIQKFLGIGCLLVGGLLFGSFEATAAPISINLSPSAGGVVSTVSISGRRWRRINSQRWDFFVRVWVRNHSGWKMVALYRLKNRHWTRSYKLGRFCHNTFGQTRASIQVGIHYNKWWWNRGTRKWQRTFLSVSQKSKIIDCGTLPQDLPPGSPPESNGPPSGTPGDFGTPAPAPAPTPVPAPTPEAPVPAPNPGNPDPLGQPAPTEPAPVPVPVIPTVSRETFLSFYSNYKALSFDRQKLRSLWGWTGRLGVQKLHAWQIRRLLKALSFGRGKLKAAGRLSHYALRPLRARQVARIISVFSFDRMKLKAALYFCRGLADPLNTHLITKEFSFSSYKNKILRRCR